ncbi:hypothetical protein EG329_007906 [Mollisiaceae sp. DMI_Dod_QoI]|nr:hypothetical protein EG329_007906 [Helotiales sp. DMI_Dod_QoI]
MEPYRGTILVSKKRKDRDGAPIQVTASSRVKKFAKNAKGFSKREEVVITGQESMMATLVDMPSEIISMIFECLSPGPPTILGLTCCRYYSYLKSYHPTPIPLTPFQCLGHRLMHSIIMQNYRPTFRGSRPFYFLNKTIYGDYHGQTVEEIEREHKLRQRYCDWFRAQIGKSYHGDFYYRSRLDNIKSVLPKPYNMVIAWNQQSLEVIKTHLWTIRCGIILG